MPALYGGGAAGEKAGEPTGLRAASFRGTVATNVHAMLQGGDVLAGIRVAIPAAEFDALNTRLLNTEKRVKALRAATAENASWSACTTRTRAHRKGGGLTGAPHMQSVTLHIIRASSLHVMSMVPYRLYE